ncbi:MAG: DNA polymerase [Ktedonobacterales bacterium]
MEGEPYWLDGEMLRTFFARIDPEQSIIVSHNALFDMGIVAWRYNFVPRLMVCTLSIARAMLGHELRSLALKQVARHLGLGEKGDTLMKVDGMNRAAIIQAGLYEEFTQYGLQDVVLCAGIYDKLVRSGEFPVSELAVLDMVLRCAIQPQLRLDQNVLAEHLAEVKAHKGMLLAQSMLLGGNGKSDLMSNEKFAELLRQHGVEPPTKRSPATGLPTYAFAKTDDEFIELSEHPNVAIQTLVGARLGHKSTIEETRCQRMLNVARVTWPGNEQSLMPIPLRYGGAHTHRLSGDWKLNMQNLPRGSKLRRALIPPPDHAILAIDSAQVEARIVAALAGEDPLVKAFEQQRDVYAEFASAVFQRPVTKKGQPKERFIGKTSILGLGFGCGWLKFQTMIDIQSRLQLGEQIKLPDDQAQSIVSLYREMYPKIPIAWKACGTTGIDTLAEGGTWSYGPCTFEKAGVILPNGLRLKYHDLHRTNAGDWYATYGGKPMKVYGGKIFQNIVQALARIAVMEAGVRIQRRIAPLRLAMQVHDELVYVTPTSQVNTVKSILMEEMCRRPVWLPSAPLFAEPEAGANYGDAKPI